jgi:hypothetical protein
MDGVTTNFNFDKLGVVDRNPTLRPRRDSRQLNSMRLCFLVGTYVVTQLIARAITTLPSRSSATPPQSNPYGQEIVEQDGQYPFLQQSLPA